MILDSASSSFVPGAATRLAPGGFERLTLPFQPDPAAARLLDAERLHVDVLLDLARQFLTLCRQQAPEVPSKYIELFEVGVGEGQHLGEEGVQAHIVGELTPKVAPLIGGELGEAPARRFQRRVQPVLAPPWDRSTHVQRFRRRPS